MSFDFFRICKTEPPKTIEQGNELIQQIINDLNKNYPIKAYRLISLINDRKYAFMQRIRSLEEDYQQPIIAAYYHFAHNLKYYISHRDDIHHRISQYHDSKYYYHVGGYDNELSYTYYDKAAKYTLYSGILLFVIGIAALPLSLPVGLILIGISLTLVAPSLFYTLAITRQNESQVKNEEIELFMEAQTLVDPKAVALTKEEIDIDSFSSLTII